MNSLEPAPYPADTRAKGWRFELDYERIKQSDTWALTPAELRPWLLMLLMTAWEQAPCGSLPSDSRLIAARIDMPLAQFQQVRDVLLRGWWAADDGRLYHDVITEHVLAMLAKRRHEADRSQKYRQASKAARDDERGVTVSSRVTHGGLQTDSGVNYGGVHHEQRHQNQNQDQNQTEKNDEPIGSSVRDESRNPIHPKEDCPHQAIIAAYHRELPELRRVEVWNNTRRGLLRSRWREAPERQDIGWWVAYFIYVREKCPHLLGKGSSGGRFADWQADLEWLIRPNNMAKVLEGKYAVQDTGDRHAA